MICQILLICRHRSKTTWLCIKPPCLPTDTVKQAEKITPALAQMAEECANKARRLLNGRITSHSSLHLYFLPSYRTQTDRKTDMWMGWAIMHSRLYCNQSEPCSLFFSDPSNWLSRDSCLCSLKESNDKCLLLLSCNVFDGKPNQAWPLIWLKWFGIVLTGVNSITN